MSPRSRLPGVLAALSLCTAAALCQSTTDALHYRLEIELLFTTQTVTATNTATFKSLTDNLATLDLDLVSALTVSSVRMNGVPVAFTRPTDVIHVTLDRAYNRDEQFTLEINYAGAPPGGGFGAFSFTTHSGSQMVWTLSEPWYAKYWWPGKDTLGDKSTFEVWVTHPNTMTAASNGLRQGIDTLTGNRLRTRWSETYPIAPYLVSLAVTNYQTRTDTYTGFGANMPVEFYVFPESYASWQSGLNLIVPMLTAFSSVFGQFPFVNEKYGIAQFTWSGGMEHQTITSQFNVSEYLSAHEMAHSWWGDNITCATWHDSWLNEGFATFGEAIWAENKPGGGRSAYFARMATNRPTSVTGSAYVQDISNENNVFSTNNVYRRGAWVLHQLRHVLGDTLFFQCLRDYRTRFEGGSATTQDFVQSCRTTTGQDLQWFFDQWVMRAGAPAYRYGWRTATRGGVNYLYLQLDQTQTLYPLFVMPIDVAVTTPTGSHTFVVWDNELRDQMAIPLDGPASAVTLDPEGWVMNTAKTSTSYAPPFFAAEPETLDTTAGGTAHLHMDQGAAAANRPYLVLCGLSGSTPGIPIGTVTVPVRYDAMTELGILNVNTPLFASFAGALDLGGQGMASLSLPPGLATPLAGTTLTFAYVLIDSFNFASRPVAVTLR